MNPLLDTIPNLLNALSLVGLGVFGYTYATNARWTKYPTGRAMMWLIVSMGMILAMAFFHLLVDGDYPGVEFVRILLYGNMTASIWHFVRVLFNELQINLLWLLPLPRRRRPNKHSSK